MRRVGRGGPLAAEHRDALARHMTNLAISSGPPRPAKGGFPWNLTRSLEQAHEDARIVNLLLDKRLKLPI